MENNKIKQNKNIKNLLQKIESNEITPHTKNYFRFRFLIFVLSLVAIFIVSVFLCSFIIFNARVSGQISLIGFGGHGINLFLELFPWKLFILDIILIIFASWLIHSFRFGYKTPVIYLLLGTVTVMVIGGFIIDKGTSLHYILLRNADNYNLPILGNIYRCTHKPLPYAEGIFKGKITSINGNTFIVNIESEKDENVSSVRVIMQDPKTINNEIKVGDNIFIAGQIVNGDIFATVIQPAPSLPFVSE